MKQGVDRSFEFKIRIVGWKNVCFAIVKVVLQGLGNHREGQFIPRYVLL
ncbi:MAG: hypothetical protein CM15mP120_29790 [Pseudomonadota bacterium]|nr:MAG: hypothetical protein CM15mP120_29790 [Pseudomonadota bacterium]